MSSGRTWQQNFRLRHRIKSFNGGCCTTVIDLVQCINLSLHEKQFQSVFLCLSNVVQQFSRSNHYRLTNDMKVSHITIHVPFSGLVGMVCHQSKDISTQRYVLKWKCSFLFRGFISLQYSQNFRPTWVGSDYWPNGQVLETRDIPFFYHVKS